MSPKDHPNEPRVYIYVPKVSPLQALATYKPQENQMAPLNEHCKNDGSVTWASRGRHVGVTWVA